MPLPPAALIEILEVGGNPASVDSIILPNEIRINGSPVLAPSDHPVIVHEVNMEDRDAVYVTLTLFARRVVVEHRPADDDA